MEPPSVASGPRSTTILRYLNKPWKIVVAVNLAALLAAGAIMLASGRMDIAVLAVVMIVAPVKVLRAASLGSRILSPFERTASMRTSCE